MKWAYCPRCKQPRLVVSPTKVDTTGKPLHPPQLGAPRIRQHGTPPCEGSGSSIVLLEVHET